MKKMTNTAKQLGSFFFTFFLFTVCVMKVQGQCGNLVPNPSFEDYTQCPDMEHQIERASFWIKFKGSAEYFNACDTLSYVGVPNNTAGYQQAATGQAYAGIYSYGYRDFMGIQLASTLVVGTKYYVTIKVSPTLIGILPFGSNKYVSNNLGVLFTTTTSSDYPTTNFAHVYSDSIISDTTTWATISGSFIADSAYQYVVVGNFFDDNQSSYVSLYPSGMWNMAYYFIDDICVSLDSLGCTCDDNNACTVDTCSSNSGCINILISCDDNDICTKDVCDSVSGCFHSVLDCNDHNVCTIDACDSIVECIHTSIECDDSDSCTINGCDSIGGCFYTPIVGCIDGIRNGQAGVLSVFPNPSSGLIVVECAEPVITLNVYNSLGRLVNSWQERESAVRIVTLNLSAEPSGIYLLIIETNNLYSSRKIFLTH